MIRQKLIDNEIGARQFRWRSHEVSRMEGLSDAVFGFAITLLVVSLEVPKTFRELSELMSGFRCRRRLEQKLELKITNEALDSA